MVLKRAFSYAIDLEMCDRNPLQCLRAPKAPKKEQRILELEEISKLLATGQGSPWFPLFFTALATSMRQGELFGLTWDDVRVDVGYLRVTKQLVNGRDGLELGEPKTTSSKRRIDLAPEAVAVLKAHRNAQISAEKTNLEACVQAAAGKGRASFGDFSLLETFREQPDRPVCEFENSTSQAWSRYVLQRSGNLCQRRGRRRAGSRCYPRLAARWWAKKWAKV
jgi:integrase